MDIINYSNVVKKLFEIQQRLKAPKDKYNSFGKYKYRSAESIIESVKPILNELKCVLVCESKAAEVGGHTRLAVKATLIDVDSGETYSALSEVREDEQRAGMCASQNSGSSESFAKKYALGNLFAIDDAKDDDDDDLTPQNPRNRAQTNAEPSKTAQDAPTAKKVSTPVSGAPKATARLKAGKTEKNPKAVQAWQEFKALESSKALPDTEKSKVFVALCKQNAGKTDPNTLTDAEWDDVLQAICNMRAA